ncbi:hypothetical protein KCO_19302 [Pectobacterium brasiliense ICMP 19477]|nr:hypothetical protein KCO_19302 [Pectobacterium brasiliense ICMP 19477]
MDRMVQGNQQYLDIFTNLSTQIIKIVLSVMETDIATLFITVSSSKTPFIIKKSNQVYLL